MSLKHNVTAVAFEIKMYPEEIFNLPMLTKVNISFNNLSGSNLNFVTHCSSLTAIDLSMNNLAGEISRAINNITVLSILNLSMNHLKGSMLEQILDHARSLQQQPRSLHTPKTKAAQILDLEAHLFRRLNFKANDVLECLKEENIIRKGGVGIVYRGTTNDSTNVAIKRLVDQGRSGFKAEIETLGRIRHKNIVRLLGYVWINDTNLLVYEYMSHRSLGKWLHGLKGGHLQWEARYKIKKAPGL